MMRTRLTFPRAVMALGVLALTLEACRGTPERPPNVVMIVVDTLRADRLGVYGNPRGLTPFLDGLAQRGVVFVNTSASSSWTVPSVVSLFTSRYPSQHQVVKFSSRLAEQEVTFAERLRDAHYLGAGFSANFRLLERLGHAQGFQYWRSDAREAGGMSGTELNAQSLAWLDGAWQRSSSQPVLLYLQYMEPHSPYNPPEPFRSRFARNDDGSSIDPSAGFIRLAELSAQGHSWAPQDLIPFERLYDAEVATVDDDIRQLFGELERRGVLDRAVVVITADHGEEFGEHGGLQHGRTLYNECIRVPLIVVGPGIAAGRRVEENVSLLDVAPTLLDLLSLPAEKRFEGRSLLPLLRPGAAPEAAGQTASGAGSAPVDVFFELIPTGLNGPPEIHERGIRRGPIKLLFRRDGGRESYDLGPDPGEHHPDPPEIAQQVGGLARDAESTATTLRSRASAPVEGEAIDEATKEKLRVLGYRY